MRRSPLRHLLRCRLLFALALCAWLGLAGAAWAHADCCAGVGGMTGAMTMGHHGGAPAPLHAAGVHAGCTCAHLAVTLPELAAPAMRSHPVTMMWLAWPAAAPEFPRAPPLRPPLA